MADATKRVGVVIVERAGSRGQITLRRGICRQLRTQSALCRSIRRGSLEGSMEGTFVNRSGLYKRVLILSETG